MPELPTPTFCAYPWLHVYSETGGQLLSCCSGNDRSLGNAEDGMLRSLNHPLMKDIRKTMLAGKWHPNCEMCRQREDVGGKSSRTTANFLLSKWVKPLEETEADGTLRNPQLKFMDLRFSNLCNFKCRTCNTIGSSAWFEDEHALRTELGLGPIEAAERKVLHSNYNMAELEAQMEHVRRIDFVGGEPLLDKKYAQVMNWLIERGRTDVEINFITNLSRLNIDGEDVLKLWSKFENLELTISMDGFGERAEYIRNGTHWPTLERNFDQLRERLPETAFCVHFTYCLLNAHHAVDFHRWLVEDKKLNLRVFHLNMLLEPYYLRADILPGEWRAKLIERFEDYARVSNLCAGLSTQNFETGRHSFAAAVNSLKNPIFDEEWRAERLKDFFAATDLLDRRRGESFATTFPEYADLRASISHPERSEGFQGQSPSS